MQVGGARKRAFAGVAGETAGVPEREKFGGGRRVEELMGRVQLLELVLSVAVGRVCDGPDHPAMGVKCPSFGGRRLG